jgi:hypothetical protein
VLRRAVLAAALLCSAVGCGGEDAVKPSGSVAEEDRFTDVAPRTGLTFEHYIGATGEFYFPEIMGAGCALLDYDGDGDLDAYLVQGGILGGKDPGDTIFKQDVQLPARNALFRNELIAGGASSGTLRFVDVTEESGAGDTGGCPAPQ